MSEVIETKSREERVSSAMLVIKKLSPLAELPVYGTPNAACQDVRACFDAERIMRAVESAKGGWARTFIDTETNTQCLEIGPLARVIIPTGLAVKPGTSWKVGVYPRSGTPYKFGLIVGNAPGTVDSDYLGELGVILINVSNNPVIIDHGDRVAQIAVEPVFSSVPDGENTIVLEDGETLEQFFSTERGDGAYGSTGNK